MSKTLILAFEIIMRKPKHTFKIALFFNFREMWLRSDGSYFRVPRISRKMKLKKAFHHKNLASLMIFHHFGALHIEKSSNMSKIWQKNEQKPCSTWLKSLNPFLHGTYKTQNTKPGFCISDPLLNNTSLAYKIYLQIIW